MNRTDFVASGTGAGADAGPAGGAGDRRDGTGRGAARSPFGARAFSEVAVRGKHRPEPHGLVDAKQSYVDAACLLVVREALQPLAHATRPGATDWRRERHAAVVAQGRRGVGEADDRVAEKIREHELGQPQHLRRHVVQRSGPVVRGPREPRVGPGQRELDAGRERLLDLVDVAYLNEVELHGGVEGPADDGGVAVRA